MVLAPRSERHNSNLICSTLSGSAVLWAFRQQAASWHREPNPIQVDINRAKLRAAYTFRRQQHRTDIIPKHAHHLSLIK